MNKNYSLKRVQIYKKVEGNYEDKMQILFLKKIVEQEIKAISFFQLTELF